MSLLKIFFGLSDVFGLLFECTRGKVLILRFEGYSTSINFLLIFLFYMFLN